MRQLWLVRLKNHLQIYTESEKESHAGTQRYAPGHQNWIQLKEREETGH